MNGEKQTYEIIENLLFPKIFQTFRMAIQPSKLIIAFLALALICLAGWVMDFSKTVVGTGGGDTELQIYLADPDRLEQFIELNKEFEGERRGVFSTLWHFAAARFHGTLNCLLILDLNGVKENIIRYFQAAGWAIRYHPVYCIIFGLIKLAVISLGGGAICRIAALQFARGEKPGLTEALRFSLKRFPSLFTAPLAPVGIIIFLGFFVFLLGLVANIPRAGELIMGIFLLLALVAGALIAVVVIGTVAGFNLMFPAVAYDGSDCFDAISRSYSYIYSKPWRMAFYTALALIYGVACYIFVRFFAFLLLLATRFFLQVGVFVNNSSKEAEKLTAIWPSITFANLLGASTITTANWSESVAAFLVHLVLLVVIGLLVSFIISFYFSANTIIYSLMRNKVDNAALGEVYTHPEERQLEPAIAESKSEETQPEPEEEPDSSSST